MSAFTFGNPVVISDTSPNALSVAGGLSLTGNLSVAGTISSTGSSSVMNMTSGVITSTTDSSGTTSGALTIAGGLGVGGISYFEKDVNAAGTVNIGNALNSSKATRALNLLASNAVLRIWRNSDVSNENPSVELMWGTGANPTLWWDFYVNSSGSFMIRDRTVGNNDRISINSSGNLTIFSGINSTSTTSGALQVTGGAGIGGNLYLGGTIPSSNSTQGVTIRPNSFNNFIFGSGATTASSWHIDDQSGNGLMEVFNGLGTSVKIYMTTDATTGFQGALQVSGGLSVRKNLFTGGPYHYQYSAGDTTNPGWGIMTQKDNVCMYFDMWWNGAANVSTSTNGNLLVRKGINTFDIFSGSGTAVGATIGSLPSKMSMNLATGNTTFYSTTDSSSTTTGAMIVSGGVGIAQSLYVGSYMNQATATVSDTTTAASGTNATAFNWNTINAPTLTAINTGVVRTNAATLYISGAPIAGTNTTITNNYALQIATGAVSVGGGIINLTNATSNIISYGTFGFAAPTVGTRSLGTKLVLYSNVGVGNLDYAIGIESGTLWHSIASTSSSFKWYAGTSTGASNIMQLNGTGALTLTSSVDYALNITQSTAAAAGGYSHASSFVKTTMGANECYAVMVGQSNSNLNNGYIGFVWNAAGSTTNYLTLGLSSVDRLLNIYGDGHIGVSSITDSSTTTTGALQVAGGAAIAKTLTIGGSLRLVGSTSGTLLIAVPATVTSYTLTLPSAAPSVSGSFLVSDLSGNVFFQAPGTGSYQNLTVTDITDASSTTTGSMTVSGGVGIAQSLYVGSYMNQTAATINDPTTAASGTNATAFTWNTINAPTLTATNTGVIRTNAATMYISGAPIAGTNTTITNSYALQVASGAVSIGGGVINLSNASSNMIMYSTNGFAAPTVSTRSLGTKVVLYPSLASNQLDYAIGMEGNALWHSISGTGSLYKWYMGTGTGAYNIMQLNGTGQLTVTSPNTGSTLMLGLMAPSLSPGTTTNVSMQLGVSSSTNNDAFWSFTYVGAGSASNSTNIGIWGGSTTLNITNTAVQVTGATDSSSTTTGGVQIAGGLGVAKTIFANAMTVNTTTTLNAVPLQTFAPSLTTNTYVAHRIGVSGTNYNSAQLIFNYFGAASLTNSLGLSITGASQALTIDGNSIVKIPTTIDSSSSTTGALQIAGGLGIVGNINVGGSMGLTNTVATGVNWTNGAGLGYAFNAGNYVGNAAAGDIVLRTTNSGTNSYNIRFATNSSKSTLDVLSSGVVAINSTTDSSSTTTGALLVSGGMAVAKTLWATSIQGGSLGAVDFIGGNETPLLFPPTGAQILTMTGTQTVSGLPYGNGTYYIAASTQANPSFAPYLGFQDKVVSNCWSSSGNYPTATGVYSGGYKTIDVTTSTVYSGDVIDLQLPSLKYVTSVTIYPRLSNPLNAPTTFVILGSSSTNSAMKVVYSQTTAITWSESTGQTFTLTTPGMYNWIRIVCLTTGANAPAGPYVQFTFSLKASNPYTAITNKVYLGSSYATLSGTSGETYTTSVGSATTPYLNSTLNVVTSVNNSGTTADLPYPVINMIKPGINAQSSDTTATFYLNRFSTASNTGNSELQLGLQNGTTTNNTDPNTVTCKWRSDGTILLLGTADSSSTTTGALQTAGGAAFGGSICSVNKQYQYVTGSLTNPAYQLYSAAVGNIIHYYDCYVNTAGTFVSTNASSNCYVNKFSNSYTINWSANNAVGSTIATSQSAFRVNCLNGVVSVLTTSDSSTSTATGAFQVMGGASISQSLTVGSGNLNMSNATANRIRFYPTGNTLMIGAVPGDGSGDFHVWDGTGGQRILGWYRNTNTLSLGAIGGATLVSIAGTADATNATTGALQVAGGAGVKGSLYVGSLLSAYNTGGLYYKVYSAPNITYNGSMQQNMFTGNFLTSGITSALNWNTVSFAGTTTSFSVKITGWILPLYSETYTFYLFADDVATIYVNNVQLGVQNNLAGTQASPASVGAIALTANVWVPIYIEWNQTVYGNGLHVQWSSTSQAQGDIPSTSMSYNQMDNAPTILGSTYVNGMLSLNSTADSSSTTTGTLQIDGGVGILKSLYVNSALITNNGTTNAFFMNSALATSVGNINNNFALWQGVAGDTVINASSAKTIAFKLGNVQQAILNSDGTFTFNSGTNSSSSTSGALQVTGGAGIGGNLYVGGTIPSNNSTQGITIRTNSYNNFIFGSGATTGSSWHIDDQSGNGLMEVFNGLGTTVKIYMTTDATTGFQGALQVSGGMSLKKNLFIGGPYHYQYSAADTTNPSWGVMTVKDNVCMYFDMWWNGAANISTSTNGNLILRKGSNTFDIVSGSGTAVGATLASLPTRISMNLSTGNTTFNSATDSSSATTGALQVVGGIGIGGSINVNGTGRIGAVHLGSGVYEQGAYMTWNRVVGSGTTEFINQYGQGNIGGFQWTNYNPSNVLINTPMTLSNSGILSVTTTTDASTTSNGALQVSGGVSVAKNIVAGGSSMIIGPTTGTASVAGGPFYLSFPYDAAGTSHTINVFSGVLAAIDNCAFMLYIYGKSPNSKSALLVLPCTKRSGNTLSQQGITALVNTSSNMTTWSWSLSGNSVVIATDADVSVCYQIFGGA